MKVPQNAKQAGKAQLNPERAGGAETLIVTVTAVEFRDSQFKKEPQPVLSFAEYPDNELRLGKRSTARVCERLGDETDDWVEERIPLVKAREEIGRQSYVVYQVAPVEEWDVLLKDGKGKKGKAAK